MKKATIFGRLVYPCEYRLKNVFNQVKNLLRITRLEENFMILIKQRKNSVCTVSYSIVKVACYGLGLHVGFGKNWQVLQFFNEYFKNKIPD